MKMTHAYSMVTRADLRGAPKIENKKNPRRTVIHESKGNFRVCYLFFDRLYSYCWVGGGGFLFSCQKTKKISAKAQTMQKNSFICFVLYFMMLLFAMSCSLSCQEGDGCFLCHARFHVALYDVMLAFYDVRRGMDGRGGRWKKMEGWRGGAKEDDDGFFFVLEAGVVPRQRKRGVPLYDYNIKTVNRGDREIYWECIFVFGRSLPYLRFRILYVSIFM